jgi:transcriptional regulator with XRE-family HTH domain
MSRISKSLRRIWESFSDKEYRDFFVEDTIADSLAIQIQRMRQRRRLTQTDLAALAETKQTAVSRWENSQPPGSIKTLQKIASAFDVALVVKFVPFSEFVKGDPDPIDRDIPRFSEDRLIEAWALPMTTLTAHRQGSHEFLASGSDLGLTQPHVITAHSDANNCYTLNSQGI